MTAAADATAMTPTPSPLRLGPESAFATLRAFLNRAAFTENEICRRVGIESIDRFRALRDGRPGVRPRDALDVLVHLFLDNEPLPWSDVHALLPGDALDALRDLGLVRDHADDPGRAVGNVLLYPTESLHVASDVAVLPEGGPARWWDLVYAAITTNTRVFLGGMGRTRCDAFLDLCAGTGVAALVAARDFAARAWAVDITERSTRFAEFNASLNGLQNVTAFAGDLYAPVGGLTFDRIVAHPPYVPARETRMVYRDGGADGEEVTRRVVAGLPDHLRPGGNFHCACTATDRRDAPLESRIRAMLGAAADEFDIALVVSNEFDPTEYYVRLAIAGRCTWAEAEEWHHHFANLGVVKMVSATIEIVRHERPHAPFTVRRRAGSRTGSVELGRLARAAEVSASAAALEAVLEARPVLAPHVTLSTEHRRDGDGWTMRACVLATDVPFDVRLPCPPSMAAVVGRMDGTRTVRRLYEELAASGSLSEEASIERLASFVHMLAAHGLVET